MPECDAPSSKAVALAERHSTWTVRLLFVTGCLECRSSTQVPMEDGDHAECPVELLACPEHREKQFQQMGISDSSNRESAPGPEAVCSAIRTEDQSLGSARGATKVSIPSMRRTRTMQVTARAVPSSSV